MTKIKKRLKVKVKLNGRTVKTSYRKYMELRRKNESKHESKPADFSGETVNATTN